MDTATGATAAPSSSPASQTAATVPEPAEKPLRDDPLQKATQGLVSHQTAEKMFGAVQVNQGTVNNLLSLADAGRAPADTFDQDLREVDEPPRPAQPLPFDAQLVRHHAGTLRERHLLVIEHRPAQQQQAEAALHAVLWALREAAPGRKLLSSGFDGTFALNGLYKKSEWPEHVRGAVIFLYRSADDSAGQFFRSATKTSMLCKQLKSMDSQLLVVVGAVPQQRAPSGGGMPECTWVIESQADASAEPFEMPPMQEPFDALPMACASWFPGLGVKEFRQLVDDMAVELAEPTPVPQTAVPGGPAGPVVPSPPPAPARLRRWREGDVDRVLDELGISFLQPAEAATAVGRVGEAGYHLRDAAQRASAPDWTLRRHPALLVQHLDRWAQRYFAADASTRYRSGLLNLLFRLDSAQVHRLSAGGLAAWFHAGAAGHADGPRLLVDLFGALLDRNEGEFIVRQACRELVLQAQQVERAALTGLPEEMVHLACVAALAEPAEDNLGERSRRFWWRAADAPEGRERLAPAFTVESSVVRTLLLLCRHQPGIAVEALRQLIELPPLSFTAAGGDPLEVEHLARVAWRDELESALSTTPLAWLACAEELVRLLSPASRPGPAVAALATDALVVLVKRLLESEDGTLSATVFEMLMGDAHRERAGRVVAGLLLSQLEPASDEPAQTDNGAAGLAMWVYRALAGDMLRRGQGTQEVAWRLFSLVAPLRTGLAARHRRAISEVAHDAREALQERRDHCEDRALHSVRPDTQRHWREALAAERRSLQAMQAVIRAFSGAAPPAA